MPTTFDALAPTYDADFTASPIATWLRDRVHQRLTTHFQAGDHVLELGCGTGEDAAFLVSQGVRVTATDASKAMLDAARTKLSGNPLAEVVLLDLNNLADPSPIPPPLCEGEGEVALCAAGVGFAGVYANFGVLNCVHDRRELAGWLAARVNPGGVVTFGVMGRYCVWEILWHGLHGDFRTAFRRWHGQSTFDTDTGQTAVYYPTVRQLCADFAPHFRRLSIRSLGLFLPPSDVYSVAERRPRLLRTLTALESRFATMPQTANLADHYWLELRRM